MRQKSNPALDEVKYGIAPIRMYPTTAQKTYFWRLFGANRWLWNQIKDMTDKRYQNNKKLLFPSTASLKKLLPRLKQEYPWLKKASSTSLQATVEYYCNAQEAFFKQTPVGRKPPKFKGRHFYRQSATLKNVPSKRKDGSLLYPIQTVNKYCLRIGTRKPIFVETSSLNRLKHKVIKRMMVVYRADLDRFYLSFVVADQKEELPQYQAKTQKTGKKLIVVSPQYTSRICSDCGQKNPAFAHMKTRDWLSVREWTCPFCRAEHDRDVNAAKNILARAVC